MDEVAESSEKIGRLTIRAIALISIFALFIVLFVVYVILNYGLKTSEIGGGAVVEPGKTEVIGQLVSGFPQFPRYPGAVVKSSYKKQEGERVGYEAVWENDDSVSEVIEWYRVRLRELKWKEVDFSETVISGSEKFLHAKMDGLEVFLAVEVDGEVGLTEINVEFPLQDETAYDVLSLR